MKTRKEKDSVGELSIPAEAYYGVQTQRGYNNFQISGRRMDDTFIKNIVRIKKAAAKVNGGCGYISKEMEKAICLACDEILEGRFDSEFITDAIQGGAGTSANMNANEVIANRATEILGGEKGEYLCHPNDHVNMAQSTNDIIPTAGKMTTLDLAKGLLESLENLIVALDKKAVEFDDVIKMGRTQLQDAVPIRLGQEFKAYANVLKRDHARVKKALSEICVVNIGGTAIGTSINAKEDYVNKIVPALVKECGHPLQQAEDLIDSTQNLDGFVAVSGALKGCAVNLSKICNDLRLMSSGPKTGFAEITLPAKQNGSSIMPGKINPVIPEVVSQVAFLVVGNDVTVSMAAEGGQLELNAFEPVILYKLFESLTCLTNAMKTLTVNCIEGIVANKERCQELVESSVCMATVLCPYLGYKKAAEIAKESLKTGVKVKDLVLSYGLMDEETVEKIFNLYEMT